MSEQIPFNDPELLAELKRREPEVRRQHFEKKAKEIADVNLTNVIIRHGEEKRFGRIIKPLYDLK
jgi:hypothetical protein